MGVTNFSESGKLILVTGGAYMFFLCGVMLSKVFLWLFLIFVNINFKFSQNNNSFVKYVIIKWFETEIALQICGFIFMMTRVVMKGGVETS